MDPEDYSSYPVSQFEEDNVLRELNKCLLAFRQNTTCPILPASNARSDRRLNSSPSLSSCSRESKDKDKPSGIQRRYEIHLAFNRFSTHVFCLLFAHTVDYHQSVKVDEIHREI